MFAIILSACTAFIGMLMYFAEDHVGFPVELVKQISVVMALVWIWPIPVALAILAVPAGVLYGLWLVITNFSRVKKTLTSIKNSLS